MGTKIVVAAIFILAFLFIFPGIRTDTARQSACDTTYGFPIVRLTSPVPLSGGYIQFEKDGMLIAL